MPRLIVTRPQAQAAHWVGQLQSRGVDAVVLPLIAIAAPDDPAALAVAWAGLAGRRLVVFVSPNAAERFFAARPSAIGWPAGVAAAAPGPGTAEALRRLGVPGDAVVEPVADAAQFDARALWSQLRGQHWQDARVLIVRGEDGRPWLGERLTGAGAQVEHVAAYRRVAPVFTAAERAILDAALARPGAHAWLFSSSLAIEHLVAAAGRGHWSASRAVATHERIAARAREAGFAHVSEALPTLDAVVACIQSIAT
ncbi:MAG: uroporphyrinogen-III synthase [Caldimonas sp.]